MSERDGDIGLVGLGLMGSAMAGRLLETGHRVHGYDPDEAACQAHERRGGAVHTSPADVARRCTVVLLSLPDGNVSRAVCLGEGGVLEGARDGSVVIDTTTASPQESVEIGAALAAAGVRYFDAGLSGSSDAVRRKETLGVVGGAEDSFDLVRGILDAFCREVRHVGELGDGMRTKLVINNIHGLHRFALAEGLVLAEKIGLDIARTLEALRASAA
jgi:3-hydroxyisobutyrate dehydrogenase-like beta-hydroxyacid dehydrogenase